MLGELRNLSNLIRAISLVALTLTLSVNAPLPWQFYDKAYANELLMKKVTSQDRL